MIKLTPDLVAKVRIYTKEEGGLHEKPIPPQMFHTTFAYEGQFNDCIILLNQLGISLNPGDWLEVPIKFLAPWLIKPHLTEGSNFYFWAGKYVGEGIIEK